MWTQKKYLKKRSGQEKSKEFSFQVFHMDDCNVLHFGKEAVL